MYHAKNYQKSEQYASFFRIVSFVISDYIAIVLGQYLAYYLRLEVIPLNGDFHIKTIYFILIVPIIFLIFFYISNVYGQRIRWVGYLRLITKSIAYAVLTIAFLMYLGQVSAGVSRLYILMSTVFIYFFVLANRMLITVYFKKKKLFQIPAVLIGAGKTAELVLPSLSESVGSRFHILGYFDDEEKETHIGNQYPYLGTLADIEKVLSGTYVHTAFVLTPGLAGSGNVELVKKVQIHVKEVSYVPNLVGVPLGNVEVEEYYDERLVMLSISNNLERKFNRILKRVFDLTLCFLSLIVFIPVGLIIAALIYKDSPGPVLFAHRRIGQGGEEFPCYKFRSMVMNSQEALEKHLAENPEAREEWERDFKLKDDPRVTKIGAFLRRTSLDELPQVLNVIKGEMSLVGPRPIIRDEIVKYGECIHDFYLVPPGITGLWQVSGRSDTTYEERVEMDSWYVRNWSVWMDIVLLVKTIVVVLQKKGAY